MSSFRNYINKPVRIWLQEQNNNIGEDEAQYPERGAQRGPGGSLPGTVQAGDGAAAAREDEPCGGTAPNTCRH